MLSRDSFRRDRSRRDDPSAADGSSSLVALLSVRVYDRPELDVPRNHYNAYAAGRPPPGQSLAAGRPAASCSSVSASTSVGTRRNAAHAHRRACARRGAMRRAYSMPPPKVRTPPRPARRSRCKSLRV